MFRTSMGHSETLWRIEFAPVSSMQVLGRAALDELEKHVPVAWMLDAGSAAESRADCERQARDLATKVKIKGRMPHRGVVACIGAVAIACLTAQSPAPSPSVGDCPSFTAWLYSPNGRAYVVAFSSAAPITMSVQLSLQTRSETYRLLLSAVSIDMSRPALKDSYRSQSFGILNPAPEPFESYSASTINGGCSASTPVGDLLVAWCPNNQPHSLEPSGDVKKALDEMFSDVDKNSQVAVPVLFRKEGYHADPRFQRSFQILFC